MPSKDKTTSRTRKSHGRRKSVRARSSAASTRKAPAPAAKQSSTPAAVLNQQKLRQLYSSMLKCQMLARRMQEISAAHRIVPGREAVLAGALAHAQSEDCTALADNAFLAGFLRGEALNTLLEQQLSSTAAQAAHNEKVSPAQLALIRGMGQAKELLSSGKVALVFCGEDPSALGFQQEALALAAKHKAPVVCLIEFNLESVAAEDQRRGKKKSAQPPFPEIVVDGADVVAIFRVAQEAIRRARTGHGPSLIKCVMPDSAAAQAQDGTPEGAHEPLAFMEQYLRRRSLWSDEWRESIAHGFQRELEAALGSKA